MAEYKPTITYQIPGEQPVTPETNTKKTTPKSEPITIENIPEEEVKEPEVKKNVAKATIPAKPTTPEPAITITEVPENDAVKSLYQQFKDASNVEGIKWNSDDSDEYTIEHSLKNMIHPDWSIYPVKANSKGERDPNNQNWPYTYKFEYNGKTYYTSNKKALPEGAQVWKLGPKGSQLPVETRYSVSVKNDKLSPEMVEWYNNQTSAYEDERRAAAAEAIEKRNEIRKQISAEKERLVAEEQAAADDEARKAAIAKRHKLESEKFPDMTFAQYNTDEVFDNSFSDAADLIAKAQAEKMTEADFLSAIQKTKWKDSKKLKPLLDDENIKAGWYVPQEQTPVANNEELATSLQNAITKTPEELAKEAKKAKNKEAWGKFLKGDAEKYQEFLSKTNPNLVKAVFGNSGITLADRLAGLGEILATLTANTANGIYAGVNKTGFSPVQGKMSKIYNNAAESEMARRQARLEAVNKSKIDTDEIMSYIKNTTTLSKLPDEKLQKLAALSIGKELSKAEFIQQLGISGEDGTFIDNAYDEYKYVHKMWQTGTERYKGNLENVSTELDIEGKTLQNIAFQMNTEQQLQDYINGLLRAKAEMRADILKIKDATQEEYFNYIEKFLGYLSGTETMATSLAQGNTSETNWNASGKIGYGPIGIEGGGGAATTDTNNRSKSANIDILKKYNIPVAENEAQNFIKERDAYVKGLQNALNEQIAEIDNAIAEARARKKAISAKTSTVIDDGIVKAPHMKQWIVREDGTKIRLNPGDNIYATKKKITSLKDNGKDVVPMEKEDRAVVLQKKLGYTGNGINKDFGYYSAKLV